MLGLQGNKSKEQEPPVPDDFQRALTQEVMATELLRIKALIATAVALCVIVTIVYFFATEAVSRVWHGNLTPLYLYSITGPFILFEWWVHGARRRCRRWRWPCISTAWGRWPRSASLRR